jgi:protease secretion system membrane fusion protein
MKILDSLISYIKTEKQDKGVVQALENTQDALNLDTKVVVRWGLLVLILAGGGFLVWAITAPLSQGVPVSGFIKVEGSSKEVQHLHGGIIDKILVKEGDKVELGQAVIVLNDTQLKAQFGIVETQLISALAIQARLSAERSGDGSVAYPNFLTEQASLPQVRDVINIQNQLFKTRRTALLNEEAILKETITGLQKQIEGSEALEKSRANQLRLFTDELKALQPLYEQGYIPRTRMFELERAVSSLEGQRSGDLSIIGRAQSQISEIRLKILQSKEVYQKEVETNFTEIQRQVSDLKERYTATRDELDRVIVRSPATGVVFGLTVNTVGGIIAAGQKLMDVLPASDSLLIEAQIPTHLIDNVATNLDADISFPALDKFDISHIQGKLVYISADKLTDPKTGEPYYLGRVVVTSEGMRELTGHKLQPGMPANVVIITGQRTMFGYLIRPIVSRLHFAFTER